MMSLRVASVREMRHVVMSAFPKNGSWIGVGCLVMFKRIWVILSRTLGLLIISGCLYRAIAAPPLHLFYPVADPAGPSSVYIEGGGFPAFWFHLGLLHSLPSLREHDFFCYSSGCLSVVMALMNRTLDEAMDLTFQVQTDWKMGNLSRYDLIQSFVDSMLQHGDEIALRTTVDRLHILVTTAEEGLSIQKASSAEELRDFLVRTTWIPFITGRGMWHVDSSGGRHIDGAFSRALHPRCTHTLGVPMTLETFVHVFNPGLNVGQVRRLWRSGREYHHELL